MGGDNRCGADWSKDFPEKHLKDLPVLATARPERTK